MNSATVSLRKDSPEQIHAALDAAARHSVRVLYLELLPRVELNAMSSADRELFGRTSPLFEWKAFV